MAKKIKIPTNKKGQIKFSLYNRASNYLRTNKLKITIVLAIVLLFSGILLGFRFYDTQRETKALLLYNSASSYFRQISSNPQAFKENYKKAIEKYQEVIRRYPKTKVSSISWFYLGGIYFQLGDYGNAIFTYINFLNQTSEDNPFRPLAFYNLGQSFEASGEYKKALLYFNKFLNSAKTEMRELAYLKIGYSYEFLKDKKKAIVVYEKMISEFPQTRYKGIIRERLNILKDQ